MAKNKLNAAQREVVGTNCISALRKVGNKKQVAVYCGSKEAGEAVAGAIQAAYPKYKFYKAEDTSLNTVGHVLFGVFTWGAGNLIQLATQNWKNFTVQTQSSTEAESLVTEIGSCIDEYGGYVDQSGLGTSDIPGVGTSGTGSSGIGKTTIYIIIGVALAIAAAILLTRKKKK